MAPAPFNTIASLDDARKEITHAGVVLSTKFTNFDSALTKIEDLRQWVVKANDLTTAIELNVLCAHLTASVLRPAAPLTQQVYCLSRPFLVKSKAFFERDDSVKSLKEWYPQYLAADAFCDDIERLKVYKKATLEFRKSIDRAAGLEVLSGSVVTSLNTGGVAAIVGMMVDRMIAQRDRRLGGAANRPAGNGAQHLDEVAYALSAENPLFTFPPYTRSKTVSDHAMVRDPEGNLVKAEGAGLLLITTAVLAELNANYNFMKLRIEELYLRESTSVRNDEQRTASQTDLYQLLDNVIAEINNATQGTTASGFSQQLSNIDSLFVTHFIMFTILGLDIEEVYEFQRVIYALGYMVRSHKSNQKLLEAYKNTAGISALMKNISKSSHIHLPPWIMNWSRLTDMVGILGCCDSFEFASSIKLPAVSWRYISNLNVNLPYPLLVITTIWSLEKMAAEKRGDEDDAIMQSERALQQLLLTRKNNFQNSNCISGNALQVELK